MSRRTRGTALAGSVLAALALPEIAVAHTTNVPFSRVAGDWQAPPAVLAAAAAGAVLFTQAFLRLRRRGRADHAGWDRAALFAAGLAFAVLPVVSPLDSAGDHYLLSAHMLEHVLIGDAAPLLLVLAVRGPLAFFLLPPVALKPLAAFGPLRAFLRTLLRPSITFALWVCVMLGWHVPAAYDSALSLTVVHDVEHTMFVLVGALAWIQLIDPARHARLSIGRRIAFAFGLFALSQPIMDGLLFTSTALYHPYAEQRERLLGLGVLTDQHLAGVVMLAEQLLTLGTFVAVLLRPLLHARRATRGVTAEGPV